MLVGVYSTVTNVVKAIIDHIAFTPECYHLEGSMFFSTTTSYTRNRGYLRFAITFFQHRIPRCTVSTLQDLPVVGRFKNVSLVCKPVSVPQICE